MELYRSKIERIVINNRWKLKKYSRNGSWTIIGICKWYASWDNYCYKLCFFGIDLLVWIKFFNVIENESKGKKCFATTTQHDEWCSTQIRCDNCKYYK